MQMSPDLFVFASMIGDFGAELFFAWLGSRPEHEDPDTCRRKLIKPMLKRLKIVSDGDLEYAAVHSPRLAKVIEQQAAARGAVEEFCHRCGRCKLGRRE